VLGPALALVVLLLPIDGLAFAPRCLAALTVLMAAWWMTEALPVGITALLPLVVFPFIGIPAKKAAVAYGSDLLWLFFGGFQLAFAVERWGLHRRAAYFLVRKLGTRGDRLVLGFMLAAALLSMWLLNTSTTVMLLPVAMAVAHAVEGDEERSGPLGGALMLGLAYAASVGGMGTYVGTAPNGVFAGIASDRGAAIPFARWMLFAAPLSLVLVGLIWLYLTRIAFRVPRRPLPADHPAVEAINVSLGPWPREAVAVAVIFGCATAGWVLRRPVGLAALGVSDATVAMAATVVLYVVRIPARDGSGWGPLIEWKDTARTPWHILLLFGGGFALANGFKTTGLSIWLGTRLEAVVTGLPLVAVILAVVLLVTFLTEVTSNTATSIVLLPIIWELGRAMHVSPVLLAVPATLAASCAFMLPVATPPNAIVYGSGLFSLRDMARVGFWVNLLTAAVITAWTALFARWALGLPSL